MKKPDERGSRKPNARGNVVSIVPGLEQKRIREAYARASTTHQRGAELEAKAKELEATLADMDLDEGIAWCVGQPGREARASWAQLRSLRAMRSCLRGDVEAGLAEWAEVVAAEPDIASTYLVRQTWLGRTDPAAALADCERAAVVEPRNALAYARRGDCHRVLGDPDRAIADYRRAVGLDPGLFDVHYALGTVFGGLGRHEEARAAYTRAIRLAPGYVEPYLGRAATLVALGDVVGAMRDLDRILELDPSREDVRETRAGLLAKLGDLAGAQVESLEREFGEDPGDAALYAALGAIHLGLGEKDKALAALDRALILDPDEVTARAKRGALLWEREEPARSLQDFDHAAGLAPDDPDHHVGRSRALAKLGRLPEAVAAASRAVALDPDHVLAHRLRAVYRSHAEEDAVLDVARDLRRAWELAPRTAVYRTEYVEHLVEIGAADEVIAVFDAAVALEPGSAELWFERGAAKLARHETLFGADLDPDEPREDERARAASALADLEKAMALGKRDLDVHWQLIRAREELGDEAAKLAEVDRAVAAFPDETMPLALRYGWRKHAGDAEGAAADRKRLVELGFQLGDDG